MKITNIILFITLSVITLKAQIVSIPDAFFKYALVNYNIADLGNGYNEDVDTNNDGEIQVTEAEAVLGLWLGEQHIVDMEGLQYFVNIEILNCSQNYSLINLPITTLPSLRELSCQFNQIANLDVTQNPLLEFLSCGSNAFTSIDLSQNTNLIELSISGEQLSNLDVTQNPLLEILWCNNNQLTSLDLSQNVNLEFLVCGNNLLSEINISNNSNLIYFSCNDNLIVSIDLSNNVFIKSIFAYNNEIQSLDISENTNLNVLSCFQNQLTELNIQNGNNILLASLRCNNNPDLTCIQVDDVAYANTQTNWYKDATAVYSEDCDIGVNESEINSSISLYPNPFKGILYITSKGSIELGRITVYDILGNTILIENNNFNQLNLSNLKKGVIFIKIETKIGTITKKIIKM